MIEVNKNNRVDARQLHKALGSKTRFNDWFERDLIQYGLEEDKDFYSKKSKSTGGRPTKDYELTLDTAKHVAMIQRSEKGKEIRQYLINLDNQKQSGKLFNASEAAHLTKLISVAMKYKNQ